MTTPTHAPAAPTASGSRLWLAVVLVALLQTAFLAWIVWDRRQLLLTGREITLQVVPVDPRDMFRGDYVILGYNLSPITAAQAANPALPGNLLRDSAVYVTLVPGADDAWTVVGAAETYPETVAPDQVVLKGRLEQIFTGEGAGAVNLTVRYGIESYFVPEGTGLELENAVRDKKIKAIVAVGADGTAALKALTVDGKRIVEEPAF